MRDRITLSLLCLGVLLLSGLLLRPLLAPAAAQTPAASEVGRVWVSSIGPDRP